MKSTLHLTSKGVNKFSFILTHLKIYFCRVLDRIIIVIVSIDLIHYHTLYLCVRGIFTPKNGIGIKTHEKITHKYRSFIRNSLKLSLNIEDKKNAKDKIWYDNCDLVTLSLSCQLRIAVVKGT